jgi:hypothetical protein
MILEDKGKKACKKLHRCIIYEISFCLGDGVGRFLQITGTYSPDYAVSHSRRPPYQYSLRENGKRFLVG